MHITIHPYGVKGISGAAMGLPTIHSAGVRGTSGGGNEATNNTPHWGEGNIQGGNGATNLHPAEVRERKLKWELVQEADLSTKYPAVLFTGILLLSPVVPDFLYFRNLLPLMEASICSFVFSSRYR